jgi:deazaflavin-dependent oxidoreductase (nitroreductase family)
MLILHHVGRKSGERRTTPLVYLQDGENVVIVGSMGGAPNNPAWYHNVRAAPDIVVEIKGKRQPRHARETTAGERERLWARLLEMWPAWEDYTFRTDRTFPILVLEPRER